jgi:hypothetical protein
MARLVDPRRIQRALTERIHLLKVDENRVFHVIGSTGENIYQVEFAQFVDCSCPDCRHRGNICKHIIFVWVRVLRLDPDDIDLEMDDELRAEILEKMQNIPQLCYYPPASSEFKSDPKRLPTARRQPTEGEECPVCFQEFEACDKPEDILWCQFSCGHNIHRICFDQWCRFKKTDSCVTCRQKFSG